MGFIRGVVAGVAMAAGAAAWLRSRSGERVRDRDRVDRMLGTLGGQLETRTREVQAAVDARLATMRPGSSGAGRVETGPAEASGPADVTPPTLDAAQAAAAEEAAELAADVEAKAARVLRKAEVKAGD